MAATEGGADVRLGPADVEDALALSDEARWNQTAEDWRVFVDHGEAYGSRADGRLVASAAVLPFGGFGWISMVLVTADRRRRGLASGLMKRAIDALQARNRAALLDATPEGALVYGRLGFRSLCGMARWRGQGLGRAGPIGFAAGAPDGEAKRAAVIGRDRQAFGGDRAFLLEDFLRRPGSLLLGDARNFVLCRQGRRATQVGPLVAESTPEAHDLLEAALRAVSGPVILDVLDAGATLRPVLTARGFEPFRTFERMVLDGDGLPGEPHAMLIAAGPEFG